MDRFSFILIAILFTGIGVQGEIRLSLNSGDFEGSWTVHNESSSESLPAQVPGGIYSDLKLVDDMFYRFNDQEYRWVGYENWTYETTFELSEDILNKEVINLVLHGVDTIGDVYLNGQLITSVNNMFVRYVVPIKDLANVTNTLQVRLKSPVLAALELANASDYDIPSDCPGQETHGECHINFLRKMQSSFSWDWGPAFPSVGIWKSVEIEAFNTAIIRDVVATVRKFEDIFLVEVTCYYEGTSSDWGSYLPSISFSGPVKPTMNKFSKMKSNKVLSEMTNQKKRDDINYFTDRTVFAELEEDRYIWMPNGYGSQVTDYEVECQFQTFNNDGKDETSVKSSKIGLREIKLIQEEVSPGAEGLTFYFEVNGVPIFAKGANWIPGHVLPELGYDERTIRRALQSAKDANMNMIRVWGGGVYESDLFYEVADEMGILIWQDMMFAANLYPGNEEYLQSVSVEIEQQIKRLASHPSIAIWSGNNENEGVLRFLLNLGLLSDPDTYIQDYLNLYINTIKPIVEEIDNAHVYVPSSPSNGLKSIDEGYISENPLSPLYGDVHYYNYANDPWNSSLYMNTRFASEYGFQGMPSFASIKQVSTPEDWRLDSEFSISRQHHGNGNQEMTNLIKYHLPLPEDDGSEEFYNTFIYYSQISQAMGTKTESQKYRRDRSKLTSNNEGLTMGALYWQLNDVWQAPTWSSIEFGGRWKMLHYYAVKFFSPLLVSPELTNDGLVQVFGISDLNGTDIDGELSISIYSWDAFEPKADIRSSIHLPQLSSIILANFSLSEILNSNGCSITTCFLHFSIDKTLHVADNFLFPASFTDVINLQPANITVIVTRDESTNEILIDLTTDRIAPFVWLETDVEGIFSDNGFTLIQPTIQLSFSNRDEEVDIDQFRETLVVRSLLG